MRLRAPFYGCPAWRFPLLGGRPGPLPAPPLISFDEAQAIGEVLHDHWKKMAGDAPLARDDMGWGDIVQLVIRSARGTVEERKG
jgi:hypothetical protein